MTTEKSEFRRKVLLFDYMINNADRKSGHFIMDVNEHIWLIDHGLTFNEQEKLRTVAWDHAGEAIPPDLHEDIHKAIIELGTQNGAYGQLKALLSEIELEALLRRMKGLLASGTYPVPSGDRRVIPWPPI